MKFAGILRSAGILEGAFKKCENIDIVLFDGKKPISSHGNIHYANELFENNPTSKLKFIGALIDLEINPPQESINVKIDEFNVILFYQTAKPKIFSRTPKTDPLDCMD